MGKHLRRAISQPELSNLSQGRSTSHILWWVASIAMMVLIGGCQGRLTGIYVDTASTRIVCDNANPHNCGVRSDQFVTFNVYGEGKCDIAGLDLGNGDHIQGHSIDFGQPSNPIAWQPTYMYRGSWPGPKTVRAYSVSNCNGEVNTSLKVLLFAPQTGTVHMDYALAYAQPGVNVCDVASSTYKPLRPNTTVTVSSPTGLKINFGCIASGCIYDADGEPNSSAPSNFPFPGFRKYSLVLRMRNQYGLTTAFQGGTNTTFNTGNNTGMIEVCVNDDNIRDNSGGWRIDISVDESQSP